MATYTVINGTESDILNINGGGTDVGAMTYRDGITLTATELATLLDGATFGKAIAAMTDLAAVTPAQQLKRACAIAALFANGLP